MNRNYQKYYSDESLQKKLTKFAKLAGIKVAYAALLLYYVMKNENTPLKTKLIATAALGYFILPTDAIPDLAPLVGYTDDLGVLMFAITQIADNITPETKRKAKVKLQTWFDLEDESEVSEIDNDIF